MAKEISRRNFLKTGAAAALGLAVVPSTVLGKKFGYTAPSDKLNILGVGIGGRGAADLQEMESQNIIGLCDVDWKYADHVFKRYPAAKKYNDYRRMYDELLKSADAVMVATADHTHAIIAAEAMTAGKHVYVEKPLTHSVYESRLPSWPPSTRSPRRWVTRARRARASARSASGSGTARSAR